MAVSINTKELEELLRTVQKLDNNHRKNRRHKHHFHDGSGGNLQKTILSVITCALFIIIIKLVQEIILPFQNFSFLNSSKGLLQPLRNTGSIFPVFISHMIQVFFKPSVKYQKKKRQDRSYAYGDRFVHNKQIDDEDNAYTAFRKKLKNGKYTVKHSLRIRTDISHQLRAGMYAVIGIRLLQIGIQHARCNLPSVIIGKAVLCIVHETKIYVFQDIYRDQNNCHKNDEYRCILKIQTFIWNFQIPFPVYGFRIHDHINKRHDRRYTGQLQKGSHNNRNEQEQKPCLLFSVKNISELLDHRSVDS